MKFYISEIQFIRFERIATTPNMVGGVDLLWFHYIPSDCLWNFQFVFIFFISRHLTDASEYFSIFSTTKNIYKNIFTIKLQQVAPWLFHFHTQIPMMTQIELELNWILPGLKHITRMYAYKCFCAVFPFYSDSNPFEYSTTCSMFSTTPTSTLL